MLIGTYIKKQSIIYLRVFFTQRKIASFLEIPFYLTLIIIGGFILVAGVRKFRLNALISIIMIHCFYIIKILTISDDSNYPKRIINIFRNINEFSINHSVIFWIIAAVFPLLMFSYFALFRKKGICILISLFIILLFCNFDTITWTFPGLQGRSFLILFIIVVVFFILTMILITVGIPMFILAYSSIGSFFCLVGCTSLVMSLVCCFKKDIYDKSINYNSIDVVILILYGILFMFGCLYQLNYKNQ